LERAVSDEFQDIARRFRPLTFGAPEALDLMDDAAVIPSRPGFDLVVTQDALVEGVHFLSAERPDRIARKLLRTNLSDLAAKGAEPYGCFLAVSWPPHYDSHARDQFAKALGEDLSHFGLALFGGDTTSTPGPLSLSLTAMGWVPQGQMVRRKGARIGDDLMVTGTIGDGYLGLLAAQGRLPMLSAEQNRALEDRYHHPRPRLGLGQALRAHATACADVSDGLAADSGHIAAASAVGLRIDLEQVPVSEAAWAWLELQDDPIAARLALITGGDDYELVFTVRPDQRAALVADAAALGIDVTLIGKVVSGSGVTLSWRGAVQNVSALGYQHKQ
jgi:thiamine-monophosphate kinase